MPDSLFQKKLGRLESQPSVEAWEQINELMQASKKRNHIHWYRSAAAVITMIAAVSIIFTQLDNEPANAISQIIPNEINDNTTTGSLEAVAKKTPLTNTTDVDSQDLDNSSLTAPIEIAVNDSNNEVIEFIGLATENYASSIASIRPSKPDVNVTLVALDLDFYPIFLPDVPKTDESRLTKVLNYAISVKNGEQNIINLKKAKQDLFTFAKQKLKTEDQTQLNFD